MSNFNAVVDFLAQHCANSEERAMWINLAFSEHSRVYARINLAGPTQAFTTQLVKTLRDYGELTPGTQALWHLLITMSDHLGLDRQETIDSFRAWANAEVNPAQRFTTPILPHPQSVDEERSLDVAMPRETVVGQPTIHNNSEPVITAKNVNLGAGTQNNIRQTFTMGDIHAENALIGNTIENLTLHSGGTRSPSPEPAVTLDLPTLFQQLKDILTNNSYPDAAKVIHRAEQLVRAAEKGDKDTRDSYYDLLTAMLPKIKTAMPAAGLVVQNLLKAVEKQA